METSDNATSSPAPTSTRRSGRVTKAPAKFTPDAPTATKRKRNADHDNDDVENESPDEVEESSDADDDDDDDAEDTATEEPRRTAKKKRSSSSQHPKSRKPASKKPKINGDATGHGPIRSAQLPSRPKKTVRIAIARREGDGLYGA